MDWNDETVARLVSLWSEGHSTAEIGRRINVSKNAVVGKAHRLNLPARPSPIRRDGAPIAPRPVVLRRLTGPTLPPLSAPLPLPVEAPVAVVMPPPPQRAEPVRPVVARSSRPAACCWPIGEPGTKSFRFCDGEAAAGKPYCTEHAQIAYVKVRDRREEAA